MSGFKQLVGSGGIGAASKNNFPPKIFNNNLPVVPHKAEAEVSKIGNL